MPERDLMTRLDAWSPALKGPKSGRFRVIGLLQIAIKLTSASLIMADMVLLALSNGSTGAVPEFVRQMPPAPPLVHTNGPMAGAFVVDARKYRHCHPMPRRTYCHTSEKLPVNWPPLSG